MNIKRRVNAEAMTLVEVMVAIAILILLSFAIFYGMMSANNLRAYATERSIAISHAQSALDHVQDIALAQGHEGFGPAYEGGASVLADPLVDYTGGSTEALKGEAITVAFPFYDPQVRDPDLPLVPDGYPYAFVRVTVSWTPIGNMPGDRSVVAERYIRFIKGGF